jgi:PAS domain S-box-containing protein
MNEKFQAGMPPADDSFRRVVEWAPTAMVMVDGQGCIVLINAQAERVFGYPRDQLLGEQLEKLVPERFSAHHLGYREGFFADPSPATDGQWARPFRPAP